MPAAKGSPPRPEDEPEDQDDDEGLEDDLADRLAADAEYQAEEDAVAQAAAVYKQHTDRLEQYSGLLCWLLPANGFPVEAGSDVATNASAIEGLDRPLRRQVRTALLYVLRDIQRIVESRRLEGD